MTFKQWLESKGYLGDDPLWGLSSDEEMSLLMQYRQETGVSEVTLTTGPTLGEIRRRWYWDPIVGLFREIGEAAGGAAAAGAGAAAQELLPVALAILAAVILVGLAR